MVEEDLYRSGQPNELNFPFLEKLGLKTVVFVAPEEPNQRFINFLDDQDINLHHLGSNSAVNTWDPISEEVVLEALNLILDPGSYPLMIMCNLGRHRTGTVVGCLRKLQRWNLTSIFEEYRKYAGPKVRFIELFDTDLVGIPVPHTKCKFGCPLRLDIKRKLSNRSDRVKAVDFHQSEPWLLTALYNGVAYIWNHESQALVKTFEVCDLPVRAAKFIERKSWIITGSDDNQVRVFNYNTHEKVTTFEAHSDYIRHIAVHPTQSFVLTCSDDMLIKLWDWEKGWKNIQVFEGHTHYVMQVAFNPKDPNTFASACMDKTVKVWSLGSSTANYTLEGHEKGVNCVDYYNGGDKPYLVTGADDKLVMVKVWDYQNKTCVQTLEGHTNHVSVICYHPELPIIISGSEDGTVRIWHANTYRLENTLNYGMERVWCIAYQRGNNDVAIGYDEGTISIKVLQREYYLGKEEPAVSMDSSGKIIFAKHNEIQTANVKASVEDNVKDGERLGLPTKELGNCEVYPQTLQHSPNGRFVVVCGDGEYIIYTALAWRNKSFGSALEFVWALDSNEYAIRESSSKIKLFKSFKEKTNVNIKPSFSAEGIFGGALLGIRGSNFLNFYDWETGACIRRVDVIAKQVIWSESDLVVIICEESSYVLKFNRVAYQQYLDAHGGITDESGIEEAFELITEVTESVRTGVWVGDCLIYTNSANRLNYLVGEQVSTVSHFDQTKYLLGYIPRDNRIFLTDKDLNVYSFTLPVSIIEYQTAVLRGDVAHAEKLLPTIPEDQRNRVARFLESQDMKEQALEVSTDVEHKFDLAIQLGKLEVAYIIASEVDVEDKWKVLGDAALSSWKYSLAEECLRKAKDLESLLLFYQASGNANGIAEVASLAVFASKTQLNSKEEKGKYNTAFLANLLRSDVEKCLDILVATERIPEAALMAKTYLPSKVSPIVKNWREKLLIDGKRKTSEAIADPVEYPNLFPDFKYALFAEEMIRTTRLKRVPAATQYTELKGALDWDAIAALKEKFPDGIPTFSQTSYKPSLSVNGDDIDGVSDNMSHMSLEVNTTGTGSLRGDTDFDDVSSVAADSVLSGPLDIQTLDSDLS
ncbi:Coatomer subunit beta' [Nowakowskiella sp. JEL0078]|nr:Coatomer subunit beta' [Nowakowskiella sp. JEL0078]